MATSEQALKQYFMVFGAVKGRPQHIGVANGNLGVLMLIHPHGRLKEEGDFELTINGDCSDKSTHNPDADDLFSQIPGTTRLDELNKFLLDGIKKCKKLTLNLNAINDVARFAATLGIIATRYRLQGLHLNLTFAENVKVKDINDKIQKYGIELEQLELGRPNEYRLTKNGNGFYIAERYSDSRREMDIEFQKEMLNKIASAMEPDQPSTDDDDDDDDTCDPLVEQYVQSRRIAASIDESTQQMSSLYSSTWSRIKRKLSDDSTQRVLSYGSMFSILAVGALIPLLNKFVFDDDSSFNHHDQEIFLIATLALFVATRIACNLAHKSFKNSQRNYLTTEDESTKPSTRNMLYSFDLNRYASIFVLGAAVWALCVADYDAAETSTKAAFCSLYGVLGAASVVVGLQTTNTIVKLQA